MERSPRNCRRFVGLLSVVISLTIFVFWWRSQTTADEVVFPTRPLALGRLEFPCLQFAFSSTERGVTWKWWSCYGKRGGMQIHAPAQWWTSRSLESNRRLQIHRQHDMWRVNVQWIRIVQSYDMLFRHEYYEVIVPHFMLVAVLVMAGLALIFIDSPLYSLIRKHLRAGRSTPSTRLAINS